MKRILFFLSSILFTSTSKAQDIEMADQMRSSGKIYVVVAVIVTIFTGIIIYLINLDKKISKLEKEVKNKSGN